jgi:voltage-gated sodium channel
MDRGGTPIDIEVFDRHDVGGAKSAAEEIKHDSSRSKSITAFFETAATLRTRLSARRLAHDGIRSFQPSLSLHRWITDAAGRRSRFLQQTPSSDDPFKSRRWRLAHVMENQHLNMFILLVVIVDSLQAMRLVSSRESTSASLAVMGLCVSIYIIEMVLKMVAFGAEFFKDPWDLGDFCVVVFSILGFICETQDVEEATVLTLVPVVRLVRALRTFPRFIHTFPEVRYLLVGYLDSLRSIFWISTLVFAEVYLFAVVGVFLYGGGEKGHDELRNHFFESTGSEIDEYFGSITDAARTLVKVLTFDDWVSIVEPIAQQRYSAWPYFLLFIFFGSFGLLNLMIGVLNDEMNDRSDQTKQYRRHLLASWQERAFVIAGTLFDLIDRDSSDSISADELSLYLTQCQQHSSSKTVSLHHARRASLHQKVSSRRVTETSENPKGMDRAQLEKVEQIEHQLNSLGLHFDVVMNFVEEHILFLKPDAEITRFEFQNIIASSHDQGATRTDIWTHAHISREIRQRMIELSKSQDQQNAAQTHQIEMVNGQLAELREMIKALSSAPRRSQPGAAHTTGCVG